MALRMAFMATPAFSQPILQALYDAGHEIVAVYSQPPRPAGRRGLELTKSQIHQAAEKLNLPVFTPKSLKDKIEQEKFKNLNLDVAVVVAYGLLLPKAILEAPKYGCYNGHASLLPRWRGAAPIQRAIMANDQETGMMIMKMDEGLDTGKIALTKKIIIKEDMTSGILHEELANMGADLMVKAMKKLQQGALSLQEQAKEGVTYAAKILKEETRIDFSKPAKEVQKHICGLSPHPGAWCEMQIGHKLERVKIFLAKALDTSLQEPFYSDGKTLIIACGEGAVEIVQLQKSGGKVQDIAPFLQGVTIHAVK